MKVAYHVMSSPVGLLFLAGTARGLRHLEFMDRKSLKRMLGAHEGEIPDATWEPSLLALKSSVDQLDEYFRGDRTQFTLPLDPAGTPFQLQVWSALCSISFGETRSYGDLARAIGQPRASRAVGLANHENPIAIVIPCHRVVGSGGSLTGYGGGLPRKKWLLEHERRFSHASVQEDLFVRSRAASPGPAALSAARASAVAKTSPRTAVRAAPAAKSPARATRAASRGAPVVRAAGRGTASRVTVRPTARRKKG